MDEQDGLYGQDEQAKKQQSQQNTAQALKTGLKAGATAATGSPVAGKAVDAIGNTEIGQKALNTGANAVNKIPGVSNVVDKAADSGALDIADKVVDASSGGVPTGGGLPNAEGSIPSPNPSPNSNNLGGIAPLGGSDSKDSEGESSNESSSDSGSSEGLIQSEFVKKHKFKLIGIGCSLGFFVIIILAIIGIIGGFVDTVSNFFSGIVDFFTTDQQELEEKYRNTLKKVQTDLNRQYGVCIDTNLITAALTVNISPDQMLEEGQEEIIDDEDIENPEGTDTDYTKMTKQIKLLANMQITSKKYGLDKGWKSSTGSYCSATAETIPVNSSNINDYDGGFFETGLDSSTPELIASHDISGVQAFFTKKVNEEKNYAYYLYRPPFNEDGTCTDSYAKEAILVDKPELSAGDLSTMTDSVFYWNLVNSFVGDYYSEYVSRDEPARTEDIKRIAEDIYLLYQDVGPSKTCSSAFYGPSSLCPNGVTVKDVGIFELEEYVAGVVSGEAYTSEGMEALKAQAVAARTYVLHRTNYCNAYIDSNDSNQVFNENISERAREATASTAGEILVYEGAIFSSEYDSFCYQDVDCPLSVRNPDGTYTVTYRKKPNLEPHVINLVDPLQYGRILPGKGHGRGMSQLVSYQLAKQGMSYSEILNYFYSDGVEIKSVDNVGGSGSSVASAGSQAKLAYLFPAGLPSSNSEASFYMTTINVPIVDINGNRSTTRVTIHREIAQDMLNIMTDIANAGFPIYSIGCYNWRDAVGGGGSRSHHSYGIACDLNPKENYMIKNGAILSGSHYKPNVDPYSFPANGVVVSAFTRYGWGWGGSWSSSKDYMHFSFTNR